MNAEENAIAREERVLRLAQEKIGQQVTFQINGGGLRVFTIESVSAELGLIHFITPDDIHSFYFLEDVIDIW